MANWRKDNRFELVKTEVLSMLYSACLMRDKVTGVLYLYGGTSSGGGITPLIDKDGNPIVDFESPAK